MFILPAALSLLLLAWGAPLGLLSGGDTPEWAWICLVLLIDVAHVWGTGLRIYTDVDELRRRPWLYTAVPFAAWALAGLMYTCSFLWFWRLLAYAAVWHFIRQQIGWVRLHQHRRGNAHLLDSAAIYAATLYPLLVWHTRPRHAAWMLPGDFFNLPHIDTTVFALIAGALLAAYAGRTLGLALVGRAQWGKDAVVLSTTFCWWGGMVAFDSDYAFTVTNIPIHGIPYILLIYLVGRQTSASTVLGHVAKSGLWTVVALLWSGAFIEEFLWDHSLWHERPWLFGTSHDLSWLRHALVPLLAVPQLSHYILDGFIWRRTDNPQLHF